MKTTITILLPLLLAFSCTKNDCFECRENTNFAEFDICAEDVRYTYVSSSFSKIKQAQKSTTLIEDSMYVVTYNNNQKSIRCRPLSN